MKTYVYVDGFNLYYRALKGTKYKWLDIASMSTKMLPKHDIRQIKYFTAKVSAKPNDPRQPVRQHTYLRALSTTPNLQIIYGRFMQTKPLMRVANPVGTIPSVIKVIKMEEKGSDVNIATHMIHDAHLGRYDAAILISNDSDLLEPVRIIRHELNKVVGILSPHKHPSIQLTNNATFIKRIRRGVLSSSQYPKILSDSDGTFHKPSAW